MSQYLSEAFKRLDVLNEETFSITRDGLDDFVKFSEEDEINDSIDVIDPDAETIDDIQDSYVGKVILDCCVCHSKLYKDVEDVLIEDDIANANEECPFCYTNDGFKVVGQVAAFGETEEEDDTVEVEETKDGEVKEGLKEGIFDKSKSYKGFTFTKKSGVYKITGVPEGVDMNDARIYSAKDEANMKRIIDTKILAEPDEETLRAARKSQEMIKAAGYHRADANDERIAKDDRLDKYAKKKAKEKAARKKGEESRGGRDRYNASSDTYESFTEAYNGNADKWVQGTLKGMKKVNEAAFSGGVASSGSIDRYARPGGNTSKITFDKLNGKKTRTVKAKDLKPGMITDTGKITQVKDIGWCNGKPSVEVSYGGVGNGGSYAADVVAADRDYQVMDESTSIKESVKTRFVLEFEQLNGPDTAWLKIPKNLDDLDVWNEDTDSWFTRNKKEATMFTSITSAQEAYDDYVIGLPLIGDGMEDEWTFDEVLATIDGSLTESVNNVNVETDDSIVNVSTDGDGKVTVTTEPIVTDKSNDEIIKPVEPSVQNEINDNVGDGEEIEIDLDEFDEASFDELGEGYLKKVYENVNSFKTSNVSFIKDKLILEGVIKFNSGNVKKTSFVFGTKEATKSGKVRFIGENKEIARGRKSFTITGIIKDKKFLSESFNYNYGVKNAAGKAQRLYGTIKNNKRG